jgi:hypothetical protein
MPSLLFLRKNGEAGRTKTPAGCTVSRETPQACAPRRLPHCPKVRAVRPASPIGSIKKHNFLKRYLLLSVVKAFVKKTDDFVNSLKGS